MNGKKSKKIKPALMLFSSATLIRESIWIAMMENSSNGKQREPTF